jgi:hypothetical protein
MGHKMGFSVLRKNSKFNGYFGVIIFSILLFSCGNLLNEFGGKGTDEAYYEEARKFLNRKDWINAILTFQKISPQFLSQKKVRMEYASALAGRCGLNFLGYVEDLADANLSSTTFMRYLMGRFSGVAVSPQYCTQAEIQLKLLEADHGLQNSQRLFFVVLAMAKVGAYLRFWADQSPGGLGDGNVDTGFDSCSSTSLPDSVVTEVVTGFSIILQQLNNINLGLSSDLQNSISTIQTICQAGVLFNPAPCSQTNPQAVTAGERDSMRDVLKSSTIGLENCLASNNSCCP